MKDFFAKIRDHHFVKSLLGRQSVVIDLGANEGDFARGVTGLVSCRCFAVEASPQLASRLKSSCSIKYFNYALGADNEPKTLFIADRSDSNSLIHFKHLKGRPSVEVPGKTLESLWQDLKLGFVDLLKMDIEGAEIDVFCSTADSLIRNIGQITVEFHDFVKPGEFDDDIRWIKKRLSRLGFVNLNFTAPYNHSDVLFFNINHPLGSKSLLIKIYFAKYVYLPLKFCYKKVREMLGISK